MPFVHRHFSRESQQESRSDRPFWGKREIWRCPRASPLARIPPKPAENLFGPGWEIKKKRVAYKRLTMVKNQKDFFSCLVSFCKKTFKFVRQNGG